MGDIASNGTFILSLLSMAGGAILATAAGIRWALSYVDNKVKVHSQAEKKAREDLQRSLESRIEALDMQVHQLTRRESIYLHRIYQLEAVIITSGIPLPFMDGWPHNIKGE